MRTKCRFKEIAAIRAVTLSSIKGMKRVKNVRVYMNDKLRTIRDRE